jgi:hypothetical protein
MIRAPSFGSRSKNPGNTPGSAVSGPRGIDDITGQS